MFNISSNLLTYYKHVFEVICHNVGNQYINCDINLQQTNDISYTKTKGVFKGGGSGGSSPPEIFRIFLEK